MAHNGNHKDPDRVLRGRLGGYALRASHNPSEYTAKARRSFLDRFTPTDPNLSDGERHARGEAALKLHMLRLARLSAKARRR
jgi:hypothetical protein